MNKRLVLFLVFFSVMIVLAFSVARKTNDHLTELQQQGFVISQDFNGVPRLLVDENQQRIAIVDGKGAVQLSFDQIQELKVAYDGKKEAPVNYRIELSSDQLANGSIGIVYENEWRAKQEFARFKQVLGR